MPLHIDTSTPKWWWAIAINTVRVLDNRLDTSRIQSEITSNYSLQYTTLNKPAAEAVKEYIEAMTAPAEKGGKNLLLNIRAMGVTNKYAIPRKKHTFFHSPNYGYNQRENMLLYADAYYELPDGRYKKVLTMNYSIRYDGSPLANSVGTLLKILIAHVSIYDRAQVKKNVKNSMGFVNYTTDTATLSFEQIDRPAIERWADYPAMNNTSSTNSWPAADGRYLSFPDFLEDRVTPQPIEFFYDAKDSLYLPIKGPIKRCWAVRSGGEIYMPLYEGGYVKLHRDKGVWSFYVPRSIPDMYALLCLEIVLRRQRTHSAHSGNNLADLSGAIIVGALTQKSHDREIDKIISNGLRNNYRYCTIDMDSGDFLFSDVPGRLDPVR